MKVRVTYGIDKVLEGAVYHEQHIINDLKMLAAPATPLPKELWPDKEPVKGIDTEYDPDFRLLTIGLAGSTGAWAHEVNGEWEGRKSALENKSLQATDWLVGHNIPGDIDHLAKNGRVVKDDWYKGKKIIDTMVLAKLEDENKPRGSYGLEPLMLTSYNVPPWKAETDEKFKETHDATDWTPKQRVQRCRLDAWATLMLAKKLYPKLAWDVQTRLLVETLHRISMTLYRIGLAGAKVDREYLTAFKTGTAINMAQVHIKLIAGAVGRGWSKPEPFCPTKDDDIRHLLFDLLRLTPTRVTQSGKPAVDKVSLKQYTEDLPEFIPDLLEYNKLQKLDSVYGDIEDDIDKEGYLHFWINQLGARTGRRSSGGGVEGTPSSKNAQNWPPSAKGMIVSRFPGGKIGAFDYQSLEPVLYAWLSKDANLFDFFYNGRGYLDICKRVLNQDIDKTSKIYRAIKNMTLGLFYNMQHPKMARNLWEILDFKFSEDYAEHVKETERKRKQILNLFPGLQRYMERQKLELAHHRSVTAPDGFVRHLPHHGEKNTAKYWTLTNQAINAPVQHLASMVTGCALIDCEEAMLNEYGIKYAAWQKVLREKTLLGFSVLINEVHDELTWDLYPKTLECDKALILEVMSKPPSLRKLIPDFDLRLKIEAKIDGHW